ncbi:MAG: hypothetical protein V7720_06120 [Halioglobus sp.]
MNDLLVNSGRYLYFLNGELTKVEESWQCEPKADGRLCVRSTRKVPGLTISVVAWIDAGVVTAFELGWDAGDATVIEASYALQADSVEYSRSLGGTVTHPNSVISGEHVSPVLYPLMRVFTGSVIRQLATDGGSCAVLVPSVSQPDNPKSLLLPDITKRRVVDLGDCDLQQIDGATIQCSLWQFIGGQYGADARFWLDESNHLQRYCWRQDETRQWDVRLA